MRSVWSPPVLLLHREGGASGGWIDPFHGPDTYGFLNFVLEFGLACSCALLVELDASSGSKGLFAIAARCAASSVWSEHVAVWPYREHAAVGGGALASCLVPSQCGDPDNGLRRVDWESVGRRVPTVSISTETGGPALTLAGTFSLAPWAKYCALGKIMHQNADMEFGQGTLLPSNHHSNRPENHIEERTWNISAEQSLFKADGPDWKATLKTDMEHFC